MSADLHSTAARRKLILMGAGASNLQIAGLLFRKKIPNLEIACIANEEHVLPPSALPGVLAGRYSFASACIPVQKVLERLDVLWVQDKVKAIHAQHKSLQLQEGHTVDFDWLSINATPHQHRDHIEKLVPGAKKYGFFVYPMELFTQHWNRLCAKNEHTALRIAVIGGDLSGMEIALSVRQRLPHAAVTFIAQTLVTTNSNARSAASLLLQEMRKHRITFLQDSVLACSATHVQLGCGAQLVCDVPIIALKPQKPAWLEDHSKHTFFWPLHCLLSTEHVYSALTGAAAPASTVLQRELQTYYGGAHFGIAQWGQRTIQGRFAGWLHHYKAQRVRGLSAFRTLT